MIAPDFDTIVQNALDHIRGAWRFCWIAMIVAWCVALVLWGIIFLIPDTYQGSARVFVDTNTALSKVTRGISVDADLDTQIQRVRQALLGGPQLRKVAEQTGLLAGVTTPRAQQLAVNDLREAIDITGGISPSAGVFTISYKSHSRDKSLQVVAQLVKTFVEGALGGKRQGSEQAQQFLITQIGEYERRLSSAEERLADFKKRNVGLMPGAEGDYFTRLETELDALAKARQSLAITVRRREELRNQLQGGATALITGESSNPKEQAASAAADTASQIRETQAKLDSLLLRYTENHPDVIALRETLSGLRQRQQAEIEALKRGEPGAAERLGLTGNPVYQNVELQYHQAQVDVSGLQAEIANHEATVANLRSLINTAPEVEAEFARLNRDYDVTRAQYRALLERLEHSKLGEEAEATGVVKFEVIDPPAAGFTPISPNRRLLIAGSFVVALAAGAAAAYLMSLLRPVFFSARQLAAGTGIPVLGEVSLAWLDQYRARRNRGVALYGGAVASLLVVTIAVLILQGRISELVRGVLA